MEAPARSTLLRPKVLVPTAVVVALLAFVMVWFQPHKLFIDDEVDQAAPEGAVALGFDEAAGEAPAADAPMADDATAEPPAGEAPTADDPAPRSPGAEEPMAGEPMAEAPMAEEPMAEEPMAEEPAAPAFTPTFVSLDHGTTGTVELLVDPDGTRFVRLVDLATDNGPDLFVYLSTNPVDGPEGDFDADFVNLGRLQGNIGSQNYELPADVDLSRYASLVIWCDRFDSAFGAASLVPPA